MYLHLVCAEHVLAHAVAADPAGVAALVNVLALQPVLGQLVARGTLQQGGVTNHRRQCWDLQTELFCESGFGQLGMHRLECAK